MAVYTYPIFLLVFLFPLAHRYKQISPLRLVALWLLMIALAYAATMALIMMSVLFLRHFPEDSLTTLYYHQFLSEGIGLALVFLVAGIGLLVFQRIRQQTNPDPLHDETRDLRMKSGRALTFLLAATLVLVAFLVIEPYIDSALNAQRVYQETRNFGLDPRNWFPFSFRDVGLFVYDMSFWLWTFAAFFLAPLTVLLLFVLRPVWPHLERRNKVVHGTFIVSSLVMSVFMLTLGTRILYWLLD